MGVSVKPLPIALPLSNINNIVSTYFIWQIKIGLVQIFFVRALLLWVKIDCVRKREKGKEDNFGIAA